MIKPVITVQYAKCHGGGVTTVLWTHIGRGVGKSFP